MRSATVMLAATPPCRSTACRSGASGRRRCAGTRPGSALPGRPAVSSSEASRSSRSRFSSASGKRRTRDDVGHDRQRVGEPRDRHVQIDVRRVERAAWPRARRRGNRSRRRSRARRACRRLRRACRPSGSRARTCRPDRAAMPAAIVSSRCTRRHLVDAHRPRPARPFESVRFSTGGSFSDGSRSGRRRLRAIGRLLGGDDRARPRATARQTAIEPRDAAMTVACRPRRLSFDGLHDQLDALVRAAGTSPPSPGCRPATARGSATGPR